MMPKKKKMGKVEVSGIKQAKNLDKYLETTTVLQMSQSRLLEPTRGVPGNLYSIGTQGDA
jgi:hypothetical protein